MPTVRDIVEVIEGWAPTGTAQSYDNVGLLVGKGSDSVTHVVVALDLTPGVIEQAIDEGCQLIITHHPLIFSPMKRVVSDDQQGSMVLQLIQNNISLIAAHTNLDSARDGVSFALAEKLGLTSVDFLENLEETLYKLVTFVPRNDFDMVRRALAESGAGKIGNYDSCGFGVEGSGYFRPLAGADPYAGEVTGDVHREEEIRFEVEVSRWNLPGTLTALLDAHPYEQVAYDVYPVVQRSPEHGMGAIGTLEESESLKDFLARVCKALENRALRYTGDLSATVRRVAVCGGSGSSLIKAALRSGADAFVTADVTYHRFFDVLDEKGLPRLALIDPGHYETEFVTEDLLVKGLSVRIAGVDFQKYRARTAPVQTFVAD